MKETDTLDIRRSESLKELKQIAKQYDKVCLMAHGSTNEYKYAVGKDRPTKKELDKIKNCSVYGCNPREVFVPGPDLFLRIKSDTALFLERRKH